MIRLLVGMWILGELKPLWWLLAVFATVAALLVVLVFWPVVLAGAAAGLIGRVYLWRMRRRLR